jgi:hypothetical protein
MPNRSHDKEQGKKAEFEEKIAKADEHLKLLNSLA